MAKLASMRNIGKEMERKLEAIGIGSAEELIQTGSKEAFLRLKVRFPHVCLVHLYTLQGAIDGIEYNRLTDAVKRDLKRFSDGLIGT
ncbi:TfoX/Sxy family DNA transformation protein [Agathobaculum sp. NTUH-O15-33]|uniref:TfoX/Sxy family DNA transformation protein n=1 Tax=Agathobaculum sp. NTUH-O15-33 TaxID=3079302 RepID=UPI0029584C91|nr:TfoX/Sxy family DNA transformation protein [Agathobaculum sp. NTUH-O15-33]WNX85962.1 TfoX/Sxy family DNA transformation protein [Agathobaculum sp. NTUH-O15-33]